MKPRIVARTFDQHRSVALLFELGFPLQAQSNFGHPFFSGHSNGRSPLACVAHDAAHSVDPHRFFLDGCAVQART